MQLKYEIILTIIDQFIILRNNINFSEIQIIRNNNKKLTHTVSLFLSLYIWSKYGIHIVFIHFDQRLLADLGFCEISLIHIRSNQYWVFAAWLDIWLSSLSPRFNFSISNLTDKLTLN